jgi:siroheme synthase
MGAGQSDSVAAVLMAQGLSPSTPVVVVENASLHSRQQFRMALRDLPAVAHLRLSGPALILLGAVYGEAQGERAPAAERTLCA